MSASEGCAELQEAEGVTARVTGIGGIFFKSTVDPEGNKVELWEPMPWDAKNKQP